MASFRLSTCQVDINAQESLNVQLTAEQNIICNSMLGWGICARKVYSLYLWALEGIREENALEDLGATYSNGHWTVRYNYEVQTLYEDMDIVALIRVRRLNWNGHISRANFQ
jgi:hypothetical protein